MVVDCLSITYRIVGSKQMQLRSNFDRRSRDKKLIDPSRVGERSVEPLGRRDVKLQGRIASEQVKIEQSHITTYTKSL